MSSSSDTVQAREGKAPADPLEAVVTETAPAAAPKKATKNKKKKDVRMTQEQIDCMIRYRSVYIPEDSIPRMSKEEIAQTNMSDQGNLPVPMDQIDDYIAKLFREVNESEARVMRERERILNSYYANGYAYAAEAPATPAGHGRRRFRPGVTRQAAGKTNKLN